MNLFPWRHLNTIAIGQWVPPSSNESDISEDHTWWKTYRLIRFLIWCDVEVNRQATRLSMISIGQFTQPITTNDKTRRKHTISWYIQEFHSTKPERRGNGLVFSSSMPAAPIGNPCYMSPEVMAVVHCFQSYFNHHSIPYHSSLQQPFQSTSRNNLKKIYYREHIWRGQWSFCCS
jgi:hypothetical protein